MAPRPHRHPHPATRVRASPRRGCCPAVVLAAHGRAGRARPGRRRDLYPEEPWAVAALRGNDLVTLVLVAPVLAVALVASRRRPTSASVLVWLGMLLLRRLQLRVLRLRGRVQRRLPAPRRRLLASMAVRWCCSARASTRPRRPRCGRRHPRQRRRCVHHGRRGRAARRLGRYVGAVRRDRRPAGRTSCRPSAVHLVYAIDMGILAPMFLVAGILLWRAARGGRCWPWPSTRAGRPTSPSSGRSAGSRRMPGSPAGRGSRRSRSGRCSPAWPRPWRSWCIRARRRRGPGATRRRPCRHPPPGPVGLSVTGPGPEPTPRPSARMTGARRDAPAEATPSQSCGLPSQHQPSLGARPRSTSPGPVGRPAASRTA